MTIYERFGRLRELYDMECECHLRTIRLLAEIKNDPTILDRLTVEGNSWTVTPANDDRGVKS